MDRHTTKRSGDRHKPRSGDRHTTESLIKRQDWASKPFLSWDGEGGNIDEWDRAGNPANRHEYFLLLHSGGEYIADEKGLTTERCLNFLCESSKTYPEHIHVCYSASYDVNMMLRDIPLHLLKKLHSGERILWKRFSLAYRARKEFTVCRFYEDQKKFLEVTGKNGNITHKPNYESKITLWDVFGFFQGSFLSALEKYFSQEEQEGLHVADIQAGKSRRGSFTSDELRHFIVPYTLYEVHALTRLMERLREYFMEADLRVTRWDGAGAVASAILKKVNIKQYHGTISKEVALASQHAYAGGRIELLQYGHYEGDIYHYDINSAYPFAMTMLPDLSDGEWVYYDHYVPTSFSLHDVSWHFSERPFYPFFYRTPHRQILFPQKGRGWYWSPEVRAAMNGRPEDCYSVYCHGSWVFYPASNTRPFAFVEEYYERRRQWKTQGKGAEKVLKLGINSLYGKTVQQLGYQSKTGRLPPFFQLQWGGCITSLTRSMLYKAAMQDSSAILAFATDGIWSTRPLQLPTGSNLGDWEYEKLDGMTLVQSGVYWTHERTEELQQKPCPLHGLFCKQGQWYRGFDKEHLTEQRVLEAWKRGDEVLSIPTTRFVTLGSALASESRWLAYWRQWPTTDRELALSMSNTLKRNDAWKLGASEPSVGLLKTTAQINDRVQGLSYPYPPEVISTPYVLKWDVTGMEEELLELAIDTEIQESEA